MRGYAQILLEEGLIDEDDAWLLANVRHTPWWDDKAERLYEDHWMCLNHGFSSREAIEEIHRLLNYLYGQKFY